MKLSVLIENDLRKEIVSLDEENLRDFPFFDKVVSVQGNTIYNIIENHGDYFILGEKEAFESVEKLVEFVRENYDDEIIIPEELSYAKFKYRSKFKDKGYQIHDKKPRVIVLDNDYCWTKGKKDPNRHDVLAFNLNYSDKGKIDRRAVDEITTFAYMLKKNDKDVYNRIKEFYPEVIKYIRCYKPERMTKIKKKNGWFWKQCSVADLAPSDKDFTL